MKTFLITAVSIMIAAPAYAESATEKSGINSMFGVAPSTQDFVTEAASSDIFEIASSKLALDRSDAPTKIFAQQMIDDHTKTSSELKDALTEYKINVTLPTMTATQQEKLSSLEKLQGEDFTKQYHSDQVDAHKNAVDLFERYSKGGDQPDIKSWAATTLPTLQHHLAMANDLNK